MTFDDRINIWGFLENCQGDRESTIRQRGLIDLYTMVDEVNKSLESEKFPSAVLLAIEVDPGDRDYTNLTEQDWEQHLARWEKEIKQAKKDARKKKKA